MTPTLTVPPVIVSVGEALVDFMAAEPGVEVGRARTFIKCPGGAMANVAAGLARLGVGSRFVSKVGADPFGRFLLEFLREQGVDVSCVRVSAEYSTGLVFAALDERRVPSYCFYGYPSADMMLEEREVGPDTLAGATFLHAGTVSMVREESRGATFKLIRLARAGGVRFSFDPNFRLHLWKDHERVKNLAWECVPGADLVKLSRDELTFMTGESDHKTGARKLKAAGAGIVVVTLGPEGAYFLGDQGEGFTRGVRVTVVDTTGAGDGFAAGLLAELARAPWPPGKEELVAAVRFANAVGALVTTALGAVTALPSREEAQRFLAAAVDG